MRVLRSLRWRRLARAVRTDGDSYVRHVVGGPRRAEAVARGHRGRDFFPHEFLVLPKCGPDGYKLARRMVGERDPGACWQIVLYATSATLGEFPPGLFLAPELSWHRQHLGLPGQVASANLVHRGDRLYTSVHLSDVVQRIGRCREYKTRIENRLHGWHAMLLNAILSVARERGVREIYVPTPELALQHTDRSRKPGEELFRRVYGRDVQRLLDVRRQGAWWVCRVHDNAARWIAPVATRTNLPRRRSIGILHDTERGYGHRDVDPDFAGEADRSAPAHLDRMLAVEAEAGLRATYDVVGCFLDEVRGPIETAGHDLAFHSFDHDVEAAPDLASRAAERQLDRCRRVDWRVRGYRPPQSRVAPELVPYLLCFHNFEWMASSVSSLGTSTPRLTRRVVELPVLVDDFALYRDRVDYEQWEREVLRRVAASECAIIGLHDCYAGWWLPRYPALLEKLRALGEIRRLGEMADETILRSAQ